jgi:hypothetical protein
VEEKIQLLFIDQVKNYLTELSEKDRKRELIYHHFLPHCGQYEITEDEFYKKILKFAFRESEPAPEEDPDPPNKKGTFVKIFGTTIHSLKKLGEVLFTHPEQERVYFEDATFIKAHVDTLEDADTAIEYLSLYKSETDIEKRYLKIIYSLNPGLPYRIDEKLYADIEELVAAGFLNRALINKTYKEYEAGKIQLWLHARDPERFPAKNDDRSVISFLTLIYAINPGHPFFVGQDLFKNPQELVAKALEDLEFWKKLLLHCSNGNLFVWFDALGHRDWRIAYQAAAEANVKDDLLNEEEKEYALVQQLLYIIEPELERPLITASVTAIDLLNLPATKTEAIPVELVLTTYGFVKPVIRLEQAFEGLMLDKDSCVFFNLTGQNHEVITFYIDPQKLVKNREYHTAIQLTSDYQTLSIPANLKTVFPLRTFLLYLLKYSFFGGLVFGLARWLISSGIGQYGALTPSIITTEITRSLPENYLVFFWTFLGLLAVVTGSVIVIKKTEKI